MEIENANEVEIGIGRESEDKIENEEPNVIPGLDLEKGYESDFDCSDKETENDHFETITNYRQMLLLNMLSCVNAEEYLPVLEQHNITHESIRLLQDDDLVAMGILNVDHRRDLLNYISSLPPLQRKSNYEILEDPLLNTDVILNLSKHIDLLTLSLRQGLNASCKLSDIGCTKPNYKEVHDPIIYPEGISSSQLAIDTIDHTLKKLDELCDAIDSSEETLGTEKKKKSLPKIKCGSWMPYLGVVLLTILSAVVVKAMKNY